jgi:hypothetical protein
VGIEIDETENKAHQGFHEFEVVAFKATDWEYSTAP